MELRKLDHIGIMVKDLDKSLIFYQDLLGLHFVGIRDNVEHKVRMGTFVLGGLMIDLIEPYQDSPLREQLNEKGEGLHHICFEVSNIERALKDLDKSGVPILFKEPRAAGDGTLVGYISPTAANNVLIELKERNA